MVFLSVFGVARTPVPQGRRDFRQSADETRLRLQDGCGGEHAPSFPAFLHFLPLAEKQYEAVFILRLEENGLESERKEAFGPERRTNTTAFPN